MSDIIVWLEDNLMDMSIIYITSVSFASKRLTVPTENPIWTVHAWDMK